MKKHPISIRPFGTHAILMEWPKKVEETILNEILQLERYLKANCLNMEEWELIPAYNSLTLVNNVSPIAFEVFQPKLKDWYDKARMNADTPINYLWKLPVCYDIEFGIDQGEVSIKLELPITELIRQHTESVYTVYGIGFLPGFMYLGGLPVSLEIPRKSTPRLKVAKGAVGIAGKQTGIYPQESPGGWNIIGNCPVSIFDANMETPCFVSIGDKIQFYSVSIAEYDLCKIQEEVGIYEPEKFSINA